MAKQAYIWDGSAWQPLTAPIANLSLYPTLAGTNVFTGANTFSSTTTVSNLTTSGNGTIYSNNYIAQSGSSTGNISIIPTTGAVDGTLSIGSNNTTTQLNGVTYIYDSTNSRGAWLNVSTLSATRTITIPDTSGTLYISTGTDVTLGDGGTNASLTASNGGIVYSTASAMAILAGTATAGKHLQSGISTAPTWTTSTYADTYAVSTILYAGTANAITGLATANSSVLVTSGTGVPSWSTTLPAVTLTTPTIVTINVSAAADTAALWNTTLTTGSISIGGALTTGVVNIATGTAFTSATGGQSVLNIGTGAHTATTKTINIGGAGTGGTLAVNIGSATGTSTTTINGTFKVGTSTITAGSAFAYTLPTISAGDTLVSLTSSSTMTNKTLTTPTINTINTSLTTTGTAALFDTGITTGTISIGGALTTGTINIGSGTAGAKTINIGTSTGTTALNGTVSSTTAAVDTNTTQIATTAYVVGQGYAKLASPTFTGTVNAVNITTSGTFNASSTFQHLGVSKNYLPYAVETGSTSISMSASAATAGTAIVFTSGRFSSTPAISMTMSALPASSGTVIGKYTNSSSTGFTPYAYTGSGSTVTVNATFAWIAIQA